MFSTLFEKQLPRWHLLFFSSTNVSNSLWPHGLQHTRLPCPSPPPGVCSKSCPLSRWFHPTISSVFPFSSCLQSFAVSGSFLMSQFFASGELKQLKCLAPSKHYFLSCLHLSLTVKQDFLSFQGRGFVVALLPVLLLLLLLFNRSVESNSLWPHGLQHTRLPCPSPSPRACSNSCPLSQWCHQPL